jgi:hypothetical protein
MVETESAFRYEGNWGDQTRYLEGVLSREFTRRLNDDGPGPASAAWYATRDEELELGPASGVPSLFETASSNDLLNGVEGARSNMGGRSSSASLDRSCGEA